MPLADGAATAFRSARDRASSRAVAFRAWTRGVTDELAQLPETLRSLREGVTNFQQVSNRLANASRALEDATALYESTFADSARRSNAMIDALRAQIDSLAASASPDRVPSMIDEIQRSMESLARMNPMWRPRPTADRDPDRADEPHLGSPASEGRRSDS